MSNGADSKVSRSRAVAVARGVCRWAGAVFVLCGLVPVAASATVPGHWDPVTAPTGGNIDQVGLLRDGNGSLHVIWHEGPPGSPTASLLETMISASGKVGPAHAIVSGWGGVGDAAIMRAASGRLLVIAGAASSDRVALSTREWTSSDDGASWSLAPP